MKRIIVELTNRCNLSCQHCFSGRHGGRNDLPMDILPNILPLAKKLGITKLSFTGGEPTLHPQFSEIIRLTYEGGYEFGFVTNGWNFAKVATQLSPYRDRLGLITFSLDGASEATHDRLRGAGSYRKVMSAVSVCVVQDIPFTINMVVTSHNRHELGEMAQLATQLGSHGLRYGQLMHSPLTTALGFDLSPEDRKAVEAEIWVLRDEHDMPIAMGPGYHTTNLFPCAPLQMQELNIDCRGYLIKCCHLSGYEGDIGREDIIADLKQVKLDEAYALLAEENEIYHARKIAHLDDGTFQEADFFHCWYCSLYYRKVDWLKEYDNHSWLEYMWQRSDTFGEGENS
jgi:MoaA/NifB/PqqE/SkfB family radical SAM enzyme